MNKPLVSIILPVHNTKEDFLKECFDSIKSQSYKNIEVIIVNDGSDDFTARYLDLVADCNEWKVIHQPKSGGNVARNRGYKESSGAYVLWLDADDVFNKNLVESSLNNIQKYNADIVLWHYELLDNSTGKVSPSWQRPYSKLLPVDVVRKGVFNWEDVKEEFYEIFPWNAWTKMYSRVFLEENSLTWNNELKSSQDMEFNGRAMVLARKISWLDQVMVQYRTNTGLQVSETRKDPLSSFTVAKILKRFLEDGSYHGLEESFARRIVKDIFYYLKVTDPEFRAEYDDIRDFIQSLSLQANTHQLSEYLTKNVSIRDFLVAQPLVSLIVSLDSEEDLKKCLGILTSQSYENIEIVLLVEKLNKLTELYAALDRRIRLVNSKGDILDSSTLRWLGFEASTGSYVTFINSSSKISSDYIKNLMDAQRETNADIVHGCLCGNASHMEEATLNGLLSVDLLDESAMIDDYLKRSVDKDTNGIDGKLINRNVLSDLDWREINYSSEAGVFEDLYTVANASSLAVLSGHIYSTKESTDFSDGYILLNKKPVSFFELCHDYEQRALELFGSNYRDDVYNKVFALYEKYTHVLLRTTGLSIKDITCFDEKFPKWNTEAIDRFPFESRFIKDINKGGLAFYISSIFTIENRKHLAEIQQLESLVSSNESELNVLRKELGSHLNFGRSVRLVFGNVKRLISHKK